MTMRIVSTGSVIVDMTLDVPALPEVGGDVLASAPVLDVGGGFNLMLAAARQGATVIYGGRLGTGSRADLVAQALQAAGITAIYPRINPIPGAYLDTGLCITLVHNDAERSFITAPGAESHLTREGLQSLDIRPDDWVAISGYDLAYEHSAVALAEFVEGLAGSVSTLLDPGPLLLDVEPTIWATVLNRLNALTLNNREARLLIGDPDEFDPVKLHAEIRRLHHVRPDVLLVIRHGEAGCTFDGGPDHNVVSAIPTLPVTAVDTTGAGDTHTGVLLAELAAGAPVAESLRRANVASAISATRRGPACSPTRDEIDAAISPRS